ncbi:hypothetical protein B9Z46_10840 [Limnohabitans sp. Hippo4]|nr:hypothetical protein B9Z46_10840 [Limnohabitans sp. Hippo4]
MNVQKIKASATVLQRLFNDAYKGNAITPHSARNWMLGNSLPTQDKLVCLAQVLDTSAEYLRFGRNKEKSLLVVLEDGTETELSVSQQRFVQKYIMLGTSQQKLVSDLVNEIAD